MKESNKNHVVHHIVHVEKSKNLFLPFFIEYFHLFFVPLGGGSFSSIPYSRVRCARVLYCVCVVFGHVWCMSSVVFNLSCHHKFFFPFDFILYAGPQSNTNTASQKFVTCLNECFYDTSEKLSPKVEQKRKKRKIQMKSKCVLLMSSDLHIPYTLHPITCSFKLKT